MKVSIIGVGRLGGALAIGLARKDYKIEYLVSRDGAQGERIAGFVDARLLSFSPADLEKIASDVVFISVQDYEIEKVAEELAKNLKTKPIVFHTSGSLSSNVLQILREGGVSVGSFHPLVSISDSILGANRLSDVYFCIEGDAEAVDLADRMVEDLGGKFFSIEAKYKALYHASAVMVAGHLVALVDTAVEMLSKCGLEAAESKEILLPLVASTLGNLKKQTTAQALTGTIARGDTQTFQRHVDAIKTYDGQEALETYLQLAARSLHLAEEQGADTAKLAELGEKISLAKKNLR